MNPEKKCDIENLERIQNNFTCKIRDLEKMDYHEQLKELEIYSLERWEKFLIINAWQQIEGIKEKVLDFKTGKERAMYRKFWTVDIEPW